jgi:hypothetical protein
MVNRTNPEAKAVMTTSTTESPAIGARLRRKSVSGTLIAAA